MQNTEHSLETELRTKGDLIRVSIQTEGYALHHGLPIPADDEEWGDAPYYGCLDDTKELERELAWVGPELADCIEAKDQDARERLEGRITKALKSRPWVELRDVRVGGYAVDSFWGLVLEERPAIQQLKLSGHLADRE